MTEDSPDWLEEIEWNAEGLVPVIVRDSQNGTVLTLAWMNREALLRTCAEGRAVYWSRSRRKLWRKGEESGYVQHVKEIRLDCDRDTVLLSVEQEGGIACHTGRRHCFFLKLEQEKWQTVEPVLKDPESIYGRKQ